ncbi:amidohydrolase family protein [Phaeovulum sp.]|uniref:amidohydrolase family protein n=1 Tax=Phaeovulum sp. TaxID=2934796 RepID=UPI0039E391E0
MSCQVDAHCHLWTLSRGDYGWLDPQNPALKPIARDFGFGDLVAADGRSENTKRVVVQAAPTVAESVFLLNLATRHRDIAAVVGWVDLSGEDAPKILSELATDPRFKGVRPMLQDIANVDWITTQPRPDAIAALVEYRLTFDALVLPQHLQALHRFATANPDLPIVIDHAAKPALGAGASDPRHGLWRDGMRRLAQGTNACCKLSGLLTELAPEQRANAREHLMPIVADLLDWFGPARLMWGSDWPVVNLAADYDAWRRLTEELLAEVDTDGLSQIYAGTARRFYELEVTT